MLALEVAEDVTALPLLDLLGKLFRWWASPNSRPRELWLAQFAVLEIRPTQDIWRLLEGY